MIDPTSPVQIRPVVDADSEAILAILAAVFAEYPGCFLELSEVPELIRPATSFAEMGGKLWVAERDGRVVGFIGIGPTDEPGLVELKKLYVHASARRAGLGRTLIGLVEAEARARGATRIHLFSDTRFETAHGVYERAGFVRLPGIRELHDVSNSLEFHYEKRLT